MNRLVIAVVAIAGILAGRNASAQEPVLDKRVGSVYVTCKKESFKSGHVYCSVLNVHEVVFGVYFGSETDSTEISIVIGAHHRPNMGADVLVDTLPVHSHDKDNVFEGSEAASILRELQGAERMKLRYSSWSSADKTFADIDVKDLKEALRRLAEYRKTRRW